MARGSWLVARGSRLSPLALLCLLVHCNAFGQPPFHDHSSHAVIDRLYGDHVEGFCVADSAGNDIYISSCNRLYCTTSGGKTWEKLGELPRVTLIKQIIPISRRVIFVNASSDEYGESYLSTDSGHHFCPCLASTGEGQIGWFDEARATLYAVTTVPFALMCSKDSGVTWTVQGAQIDTTQNPHVCSMCFSKAAQRNSFYVSASNPARVYASGPGELAWQLCFNDPRKEMRELPLITKWGKRLVACVTGPKDSVGEIYLSDDEGTSWKSIRCPFGIWGAGVSARDGSTIVVGKFQTMGWPSNSPALRYTTDQGHIWTAVPGSIGSLYWQMQLISGNVLYAATDIGLLQVRLNE